MLDRIKLSTANLSYILAEADLLAMRFALNIASILWAVWVALTIWVYPGTIDDYDLSFVDGHLGVLAGMFLIHGVVGVTALLLKQKNRFWIMLGSMYGAALWTVSLDLILLARIADQTLPMGGAHWLAAIIAWWIFMRDIFGKEQYE